MDSIPSLSIRRHTTLLTHFPEILSYAIQEKRAAGWIVFATQLTVENFNTMDNYVGESTPIMDCWKVGHYDVAAMAGTLTEAHRHILVRLGIDFAEIHAFPDLSQPGLLLMDMDSTAIQIECIDEIATLAGVGEQVAEVTERAMQGELDFAQSLHQRVGALAGADEAILAQVRDNIPLMPELRELVKTMKALGWKTAIASGGFTYFSDHLKQMLELDFAKSNTLEIVDGKLTGKVLGEVVCAQTKAEILIELAEQYDIETENTVAVGDGANDLIMMNAAGLGIAYHAKPKVEQQAQAAIRVAGLGGVLCILSASLLLSGKLSWQKRA
jgi:phosphoserine phosphatase